METKVVFKRSHFNPFEHIVLSLLKLVGGGPRRFVYGMKFLGYGDDLCCKGLEVFYAFGYEDAKFTVTELLGAPMITDSHKSKTLRRLTKEKAARKQTVDI